jgi:hypothetical protein
MAVECPAEPCDFSGTIDQVEGHLGGVCDTPHDGLVVSSITESLHGEGSEGLPVGLLVGLAVAGIGVWWLAQSSGSDEEEPEETSGEASNGEEVPVVA